MLELERGEVYDLGRTLRVAIVRFASIRNLSELQRVVQEKPGRLDKIATAAALASDRETQFAFAQLFGMARRYAEAERFFESAIGGEGGERQLWLLNWGMDMFRAEQFEAAAHAFERGANQELPDEDRLQFQLYQCAAWEMSGQTDRAIALAKQLQAENSNSTEVCARLPWILNHAGRQDEASAAYQKLIAEFDIQHDESAREILREARFALANLHIESSRLDDAAECLAQVLDEFPEDAAAMNDLGFLWADHGRHLDLARLMIEKAVAAEPQNAAYRDSLGWVLFQQGRYAEAIRELEAAVTQSTEHGGVDTERPGTPDPVILDHLGDAYHKQGRTAEAIDAWRRAIQLLKESDRENAKAIQAKLDGVSSGEAVSSSP
jgi:tetratricopeptide (TPR) repeat protein